jgi:hypothetical protein
LSLRFEEKVFSLKTTVVCLTVKSSFPETQKQQLTTSLGKLNSPKLLRECGSVSEERPNAHIIFLPTELFVGLIKKMAKYEIGKSAAILDSLNEDLHNQGFIDDETYFKFKEAYMRKLIDVVREKEQSSVKVEVSAAKYETKLEVQKSTVQIAPKKRPDYSKMSLEELEKRLNDLREAGETTEMQFVAFERKKRLAEKGIHK